jgi:two-component system response regulator DevR
MSNPPEVKVLLVDDSALVRQGIKSVLVHHRGRFALNVVGEAGSVADAISVCARLKPDIVILDLRLPDGYGFDACREILRVRPETRVLVLTSYTDDNFVYEAITAGSHGYLMKDVEPTALLEAIERVAAGESILSPDLTSRVLAMVRSTTPAEVTKFTSLSPQEKRVLELVVKGKTNKQIGDELGLSDNTVKNYLGNVFEKLHVKRRAQAAALYAQAFRNKTRPI